jgi:type IX secretion system PorP/SprF family membrane protein
MHKKRIFFLVIVTLVSFNCRAQLFPVFSQYFYNELMINPAFAGAHVQFSATSTYRNQWINFPGAPKTFSLTAHTSLVKGRVGVGILINEDKIGSYANKDLTLCYSYKLRFPKSTLSFGIQGSLYFLNADFSALNIQQGDPSFIPYNLFKPNFGAGIYYNRKNFFVGFSNPYLINSKFSTSGMQTDPVTGLPTKVQSNLYQFRNYFLRSGFIANLDHLGNVKINPSILIRAQEGAPLSLDINAAFIFYDVFGAGVSYRSEDAIISFLSLKLSEKLFFSYSFDFTTSHLGPFSSGTQELMLNYRAKITAVHKNLECPTYHSYRE